MVLSFLALGCGSESGGPGVEPAAPSEDVDSGEAPEHSIKAYVSIDGAESKLVRFGVAGSVADLGTSPTPVGDVSSSPYEPPSSGDEVRTEEQEVVVEDLSGSSLFGGTGGPQDTMALDVERGWSDGWTLAMLAIRSCSGGEDRPVINVTTPFQFPFGDGFFMFREAGYLYDIDSCDGLSRAQELMICGASRLAEVAEAAGPIVWEGQYQGLAAEPAEVYYEQFFRDLSVTIPPQATKDRFIARDMAMNVLGQALVSEWYLGSNTDGLESHTAFQAGAYQSAAQGTCTDAYLESALDGTDFPTDVSDVSVFDQANQWGESEDDQQNRAKNRLDAKVELFATAGRLMEKLIRDSVRDDLATAETIKSRAADPVQGLKRFWGHGSFGAPNHYGSANHALYKLVGPLEIGPANYTRDLDSPPEDHEFVRWSTDSTLALRDRPLCVNGQRSVSGNKTVKPSTPMTRTKLSRVRSPSSTAETRAASLIEAVGLVDPTGILDTTGTPSWIRDVVVDVLQKQLTVSGTEDVLVSTENVEAVLTGVEDEHLVFAVRRATALLELYREEGTRYVGAADSSFSELAEDSGLFVVANGIPTAEITRRDAGLISELQVESQCSINDFESYGSTGVPSEAGFQLGPLAAMQNPFLYGHVVSERLAYIEQGARPEAKSVSQAARASVAAWAGTGRLLSRYDESTEQHVLEIHGVRAADFGRSEQEFLEDLAAFKSDIAADCAAGVRSRCEGVSDEYESPGAEAATDDYERTFYRLPLDETGPSAEVVLRARDSKPGSRLGAMSLVGWHPNGVPLPWYVTVEALSPLREELLSGILDGNAAHENVSTCRTKPEVGLPAKYCIDGMDRNMYVPLANELTSDGAGVENSWRHYLSEAMEAAERADELGEELIQSGIELTEEKERAAQEFAELCGVFPTEEAVSVVNGVVEVQPGHSQIKACTETERYDLVFFRFNPFGSPEGAYDALCATVGGEEPPYRFCDKDPSLLEIAELGLASSYSDLQAFDSVDCGEVARALEPGGGFAVDYPAFSRLNFKPYVSGPGLSYAANSMELREEIDGEWVLLNTDRAVMGTAAAIQVYDESADPADYYPACLTLGGCDAPLAATMQQAFGNQITSYETVRQAVESGLFHLGALAGGLPYGAIHYPVPAAVTSYLGEDLTPPETLVPLPALFGSGVFEQVSGDLYDYHNAEGVYVEADVMKTWRRLGGQDAANYISDRVGQGSHPDHWRAWALNYLSEFVVGVRPNSPIEFAPFDIVGSEQDGQRAYIQAALSRWVSDYQSGVCQNGEITQQLNRLVEGLAHGEVEDGMPTLEGWGQRSICGATSDRSPAFVTSNYVSPDLTGGPTPRSGLFSTHTLWEQEVNFPTSGWQDDTWRWLESSYFILQEGSLPHDSFVFEDYPIRTKNTTMPIERLNPLLCSPSDRVEMWLNREVRNDCEAAAAISRALTLSCVANHQAPSGNVSFELPPINTLSDLERLKIWNRQAANAFHYAAGAMFLIEVPKQAVSNAGGEDFDYAAVSQADLGQHLINLEQAMRDVESGFANVSSAFRAHALEIQDSILGLRGLSVEDRTRLLGLGHNLLALERESSLVNASKAGEAMRFWAGVANEGMHTALSAAAGVKGYNAMEANGATRTELNMKAGAVAGGAALGVQDIVNAFIAREDAEEVADVVQRYNSLLQDVNTEQAAALVEGSQIAQAQEILSLNKDSADAQDAMRGGLELIYSAGTNALDSIRQMVDLETRAKILLAKYAGADFIVHNDEQRVPLELSTALGRIYDVKAIRYQRALAEAKRSAYMARLAIEQKLGVRMAEMYDGIGPTEAPALWVDDLCGLSGVDYERLADATEGGDDFTAEFADEYIGDYVRRLENFVENYNIEYPSQGATDRAIVSIRDEGGSVDRRCSEQNPNKLLYSHNLRAFGGSYDEDGQRVWMPTECEGSHCLTLLPEEAALVDGEPVLPPEETGSFTIFRVSDFEESVVGHSGPPGFVYQNVELEGAVDHSLTLWAGAISEQEGDEVEYQIVVYDEDWDIAAVQFGLAISTGTSEVFSSPTVMSFVPPSDGLYRIAIGKLNSDAVADLAIGNVQLTEGGPVSYRGNTATRTSVPKACGDQERTIQDMFVYRCDGNDCFYELEQPLYVDEELLNQISGVSGGGFGGSNFNYRLGSVALNLVGERVLDCGDSTNSCYTDGFVSYDLRHATQSVAINSLAQGTTCFDFKTGNVRGAKALAVERTLSLPLSSEDAGQILEQGFLKTELVGRPLSGGYHLKIWDQPELQWDNIDDIQFLVNYSYWSEVE